MIKLGSLVCLLAVTTALPTPFFWKLDTLRFRYARESAVESHLVHLRMTTSDLSKTMRYDPAISNIYHLFTRLNPSESQPMLVNSNNVLQESNYSNTRRTIVLIHGWRDSPISDFIRVVVPALLQAEDLNIFVVDWTVASDSLNLAAVLSNTITSGQGVAQFINWVNQVTASSPIQYHIIGHGLGAHQAGIAARNVQGDVAYVTGLDPSLVGWINHSDRFSPDDGLYTEVIHTNSGVYGYPTELAQVDFYPNGGESMPGCNSHSCDHERSYFYFAESVVSGGFTGRQCLNFLAAIAQTCNLLPGRLEMGGLRPKIGSTGVYSLQTNPNPPFSLG